MISSQSASIYNFGFDKDREPQAGAHGGTPLQLLLTPDLDFSAGDRSQVRKADPVPADVRDYYRGYKLSIRPQCNTFAVACCRNLSGERVRLADLKSIVG
jgi:hypothetical protein